MDNLRGAAWGVKEQKPLEKRINELKQNIVLNRSQLESFVSDLKLKYNNERLTNQGNALIHLEQAVKLLNLN